jgi:signal transduction histidine kinase
MNASTLVAPTQADPAADTARYDLSGMYPTIRMACLEEPAARPASASEDEIERLRAEKRDLLAFIAEHCRPAASAIAAYAEYLLANDGETLGSGQRQLVGLIHRTARDVMAESSVLVRRPQGGPVRTSS